MRAGVLLALGDGGTEPRFVPASVARRVVARPRVSGVVGSSLGMALIEGRVVAVLAEGDGADALLCEDGGEALLLDGVTVLDVGRFEAAAGGVRVGGELVRELAITALPGAAP
jgi:hypothetical protein